ncbi:hypothetical protein HDU76_008868, partial [Blyttiomyces sp. JEL0837]
MSSSEPEQKDTLETTVQELAADGGKGDSKKGSLFAIPVYVVILCLVVGAVGIVTIPLALIITDSSTNSISDLSRIIMNQAVDGIVTQIQGVLDQPAALLEIVTKNSLVIKTLTTNYQNLKKDVETYVFMETLISSSSYVSGINCVTYPNMFATNPASVPWPNVTMILTYRDPQKILLYYEDFTTAEFAHLAIYDPTYKAYVYDQITYTYAQQVTTFDFFKNMINAPNDMSP